MNRPDTSARIISLRRYVDLLNLEEKRLKWIIGSTTAPNPERADAQANVKVILEKLRMAEKELSDLEFYRWRVRMAEPLASVTPSEQVCKASKSPRE